MHLRACNAPRGPVALVGEGLGPPDTPHIPQRPLRTINETEIGASCAGDVAPLKRRGPEPRGGTCTSPAVELCGLWARGCNAYACTMSCQ